MLHFIHTMCVLYTRQILNWTTLLHYTQVTSSWHAVYLICTHNTYSWRKML